jgi:hypothetical protein
MANGTVYVDSRIKGEDNTVLTVGRTFLGQNDTINPEDVGLNLIRGINFTPWQAPPITFLAGRRQIRMMQGSIGSLDSETGNYVRVTTTVLKGTGFVAVGYPGTLYIGTGAGSSRASYMAWGR